MIEDNEDLNIFQFGGCGGLYFCYQLLITNKFNCHLEKEKISFKEAKDSAFGIKEKNKWKSNELFPDNNKTLKLKNNTKRIFYTVNEFDEWMDLPGKKILVYTDIHSQIRLNYYKRSTCAVKSVVILPIYVIYIDNLSAKLKFTLEA